MATNEHTRLLAPREVADEIGISTQTVYRAIECGDLSALRVGQRGRAIRITRSDIDRWLVPARGNEAA